MPITRFTPEVQPKIPTRLARLQELANDLLQLGSTDENGGFQV